jgi:hypothetical protein
MKDAGAELFFVSKKAPNTKEFDRVKGSLNKPYRIGLELIENCSIDYVPNVRLNFL